MLLERGEIVLYNGIDITVDLEVLPFWGAKIRANGRTKAMYKFTLARLNIETFQSSFKLMIHSLTISFHPPPFSPSL